MACVLWPHATIIVAVPVDVDEEDTRSGADARAIHVSHRRQVLGEVFRRQSCSQVLADRYSSGSGTPPNLGAL